MTVYNEQIVEQAQFTTPEPEADLAFSTAEALRDAAAALVYPDYQKQNQWGCYVTAESSVPRLIYALKAGLLPCPDPQADSLLWALKTLRASEWIQHRGRRKVPKSLYNALCVLWADLYWSFKRAADAADALNEFYD